MDGNRARGARRVLTLRTRGFVENARASGAGHARLIGAHLLPNAAQAVIVSLTLAVARGILLESALSYFGVGVRPPQASWGNMLLPGPDDAGHRTVAGVRAGVVHPDDDADGESRRRSNREKAALTARCKMSFSTTEDTEDAENPFIFLCVLRVLRWWSVLLSQRPIRSPGPLSPGSNNCRCAHHGAMPLVITRSWNSRQVERRAVRRLVVAPQFERRDLAEKISAVGGIVGAARRFLPRGRRRQMGLALEELRRLIDRPLAAVQPQPDDQPADPRQRFADLREPVARIVALESFVADELLGVMRPAILSG